MCIDIDLFFRHDLDWDFTHHFSDIFTRVIALDSCQNFICAQYLRTNGQSSTKLYKCIYIDKISVNKGFIPVIFNKFVTKLWPLIGNIILFLLNILRTN